MSVDWNWFFSSFCQSAAALIGIIGAFIISRLLGLTEKIGLTINQFDNLVIEYKTLTAGIAKRHFTWYIKTTINHESDITNGIYDGEYENIDKPDILKKIYATIPGLFKDDKVVLQTFNGLYSVHRPRKIELTGGAFMTQPAVPLVIMPNGLRDQLNKEKEAIDNLEINAKTLIDKFHRNLQDINSFNDTVKPLKVIIVLLMIAFPITVIYPLHFMPMQNNQYPTLTFNLLIILKSFFSLKSFLLFAFFATIEGIFYYFIILTDQLTKKLKTARQNNSDDLKNIKNYSEYFDKE